MTAKRPAPPRQAPEVTGIRSMHTGELMLPADPVLPPAFGLRNEGTRMLEGQDGPQALPLRALFQGRLDAIRRAYRGTPAQGCLVAAVDPLRGVAAAVKLVTPEDGQPAHVIIGRHERCQLRLTDPGLSLRHAALVVRRLSTGDVRVRLLDLRSTLGLTGEDGRPVESVSVEGHLFVGLGRYILMVLLGGEDLDFSDDGSEVFDALPPRVFFDMRERVPGVSGRRARVPDEARRFEAGSRTNARARGAVDFHSRVNIHRPPEPLRQYTLLGGDKRGTLTLSCANGTASVPLYDAQARDGVLLGRYERCESADLPLDLPDTVSRVHALVLAEGDGLYVMDTASTFGVRMEDQLEVPGLRLRGPGGFMLGTETTVRWEPDPG
ncbi:MAG: FHA domain-containing protein [Deltaproteobacteria bacterium]|nr:FHA domain-containing protein [Deltaproteobacteria bacterium]